MAIKVNNTTVIDDSRVLQNVTGLKTVGGQSLLGSGDVQVSSAGVVPVGGAVVLQPGMLVNNLYDAADGSKWQAAGTSVAYSADRHNLAALPDSVKSYLLTSTPAVHAINTITYPNGNYFSFNYYPTTAGGILLGRHSSSSYGGNYTSTTVSTDLGSTWNYTTAGPYSLGGSGTAVSPSGVVIMAYSSGGANGVNILRFNGSSWNSSMPWGVTYNGFFGKGIVYDSVLQKFVAFLSNGSGSKFTSTSSDGITWNAGNAVPNATNVYNFYYNSALAQYYFTNSLGNVQVSSDALNWTSYTGTAYIATGGLVNLANGRYISLISSSGAVYTSTDGANWTNSANKANYTSIAGAGSSYVSGALAAIAISTGSYPNNQVTYSFTKDGTNFADMPILPVGYYVNSGTSYNSAIGNYYAITINSNSSSTVNIVKILDSAVTTFYDQNSRVSGIPVLLGSTYYVAGIGADASSIFSSTDAGITVNSTPVLTVSGATWTKVFKVGTVLIAATDTKLYTSTDGITWTLRTTYTAAASSGFYVAPVLSNTAAIITKSSGTLVTDNLVDYYTVAAPAGVYSTSLLADSALCFTWNDGTNHKFSKLTDFSPSGDPVFISTSSTVSYAAVRTK